MTDDPIASPPAGPVRQPFLHDLVSCVEAPTVALSGADGQIRAGGVQGVLRNDRRVLSELVVDVDGYEPVAVGHDLVASGTARFVGVVRHLGDPGADPTVRLERERSTRPDGVDERLVLVNAARSPFSATVRVRAAVDLAPMAAVKGGAAAEALRPVRVDPTCLAWTDDRTDVRLRGEVGEHSDVPAADLPTADVDAGGRGVLTWRVSVPARSRRTVALGLDVADVVHVGSSAPVNAFLPATAGPGWDRVSVQGPTDLVRLLERGIDDLTALALADPLAPDDVFIGAGSPWFFTLFGRDSLWTARMALPLGTDLARGTLRTLARRQGTRFDDETAEAPGKILHEVRTPAPDASASVLPPVYFGTVDATALWVCLLHDAWRWGMAAADVADLLEPLDAALRWLVEDADSDGDGFCEYVDRSGHGLANQGWKDSGDSIQFPDGTIAAPPIALSEAQAYAYEAGMSGAALLEAFDRPGAMRLRTWAGELRDKFRGAFWVEDARGRFPAIALDGDKKPVGTATSNLGHLLGTGLLDPAEADAVSRRLGESDLDCGYGLRTMSADAAGFNPLGYHAGTVWPHDTAIAVLGLSREEQLGTAASLAAGLVRAAPSFEHRMPELFAGTDARARQPVLAYPAACRPQAWSAAAVLALVSAALRLEADVPRGVLRVAPHEAFRWLFPFRISGLRVAGHPLSVEVDPAGAVRVETTAAVTVRVE